MQFQRKASRLNIQLAALHGNIHSLFAKQLGVFERLRTFLAERHFPSALSVDTDKIRAVLFRDLDVTRTEAIDRTACSYVSPTDRNAFPYRLTELG